jgi:DNA repair protein RadD
VSAATVLSPYQTRALDDIRSSFRGGRRRVLYVLPTGGGKTLIFCFLAAEAARRGKRILILAHWQELVEQTSAALAAMGVPHGIIAAGYAPADAPVQVASVMTLVRRLDAVGNFDLAVIDEAHHAIARSWRLLLDSFEKAFVLGVTATPERLDGRGLGDIFEDMVVGPGVGELTGKSYLCAARTYAWRPPDLSGVRTRAGDYASEDLSRVMSGSTIAGDAVAHYDDLCRGLPALAYCCSVEHSKLVAARFREAGFRAEHVDGETAADVRLSTIGALGEGRLDVLRNCYLFTEGVDVPALGAVLLLRPTKSLALYLQMVGRALRPSPGKGKALILDHAGNVWRHGLGDDPRHWSLDSKKRKAGTVPVKECPDCHAMVTIGSTVCSECGFEFEVRGRDRERSEVPGDLIEITLRDRLRRMSYRNAVGWGGADPDRLRLVAEARGYKRGWVYYRLTEPQGPAP